MKQYNIIQAIVMSFYSKNLYRDVAKHWGGKAFLYLLVLLALSWIGFVVVLQKGLNEFYAKKADEIVNQVPVLNIKEGKIATPENHPYMIVDPESKETIAVIDTTGQYKTLEEAKTPVLITETEIITKNRPNETRTDKLPSTITMVIEPQTVNAYVKNYIGYTWILFFGFLLFVSFIYRIIQACFYGLIGLIFKAICRVRVTYGQLVILSMVAVTPSIVIFTILDFFAIIIPHELLISFLLAMFYYALVSLQTETDLKR